MERAPWGYLWDRLFLGKEIQATGEYILVRDGDARPRGPTVNVGYLPGKNRSETPGFSRAQCKVTVKDGQKTGLID